MCETSVSGNTLVVTLTAEETARWTRGDSKEDARFRLTIKHPARRERRDRGLTGQVVVDHEGRFLEDCAANVRHCDPRTIEARCRARDVWPPALPPRWLDSREAASILYDALAADGDVLAWLHEAAAVYRADPMVDLDPASPMGGATIEAANRRLLRLAMR